MQAERPREKTLLEQIQEQNAKLKPVSRPSEKIKDERRETNSQETLEQQLQALLKARKEELQKFSSESDDGTDNDDDDSDEFD